jgi:FkbM family methyltransferase
MTDNFIVANNCYAQKILLDPDDLIGQKILRHGIYDKTGLYFIENLLSKLNRGAIVFDVGASIGNHALRMSQYCQSLYLFEPQAHIAKLLKRTAELNNISNWNIFNMGLSDQAGTLTLYRNRESNILTSFIADLKSENCATEESVVRTGDEIVQENSLARLDFIKIDVEGFESKVISGFKDSIKKFRPVIFMEWDKEITKQQFRDQKLFENIFTDYSIKAISRASYESTLLKRIVSKVRRTFSTGMEKKRWTIGEFFPAQDYRHIILVPNDKLMILDGFN